MTTAARNALLGIAIALAVVAAVYLIGAFFAVLLAGLGVGAFYARRWSARGSSGRRRVVASLAIAVGIFLVASIAWLIGVLASAYECEYEEVHCSSWAEFLAANVLWGFLPIAGLSLAAGWLTTSRRAG